MNRRISTVFALALMLGAPTFAQEVSHTQARDAADALDHSGLALIWTGGQRDPVRLLAVITAQTQTSGQGGELYVTASAVATGRQGPGGFAFSARPGEVETRRAQPGQLYVAEGPAAGGGTLFVPLVAPPAGAPGSILVPHAMVQRARATRAQEGGTIPPFLHVGERDREHLVGRAIAGEQGRLLLQVDEDATAAMSVDPFAAPDAAPAPRPGPARRVELPRAIANELRRAGDREVVLVAAVENGKAERVTLVEPSAASWTGRIRRSGDGWELATGVDGAVPLAQLPPTLAAKLDGQVATVRGLGFMSSGDVVVLAVDADLEGQPVRVVGLQRDAKGRAIATVRRPGVDEDRPVALDALDFAADGTAPAPTPGLVGSLPASALAR